MKAGVENRDIVDFVALKGQRAILAKDVANLRQQFFRTDSDRAMLEFITQLEDKGYDARWTVNEDNELTALFFTHATCVDRARRLSEEIIIDATYKTNRHKLPYINIVGVSNVSYSTPQTLATLGIAGAWVSSETESSYVWVYATARVSCVPTGVILETRPFRDGPGKGATKRSGPCIS